MAPFWVSAIAYTPKLAKAHFDLFAGTPPYLPPIVTASIPGRRGLSKATYRAKGRIAIERQKRLILLES